MAAVRGSFCWASSCWSCCCWGWWFGSKWAGASAKFALLLRGSSSLSCEGLLLLETLTAGRCWLLLLLLLLLIVLLLCACGAMLLLPAQLGPRPSAASVAADAGL
jgi:hypothetical protein